MLLMCLLKAICDGLKKKKSLLEKKNHITVEKYSSFRYLQLSEGKAQLTWLIYNIHLR